MKTRKKTKSKREKRKKEKWKKMKKWKNEKTENEKFEKMKKCLKIKKKNEKWKKNGTNLKEAPPPPSLLSTIAGVTVQLSLMPARNSPIQQIQEHAEKWSENMWTTLPKKNMWRSLRCGLEHEPVSFSRSNEDSRSRSIPWMKNERSLKDKSSMERSEERLKTDHFPNSMDFCHCKHAENAQHFHKLQKGELCFGETTAKAKTYIPRARCFSVSDGSGKALGHHLKFLGVAGEASDAVSAYTRVKLTEPPSFFLSVLQRRMSRNVDQNSSTTKTNKLWWNRRSCGFSCKECVWSPVSWLSVGKKNWRSGLRKWMEEHETVFTCAKSSDSSHQFMCMTWGMVGKPCGKFCSKKATSKVQRHS